MIKIILFFKFLLSVQESDKMARPTNKTELLTLSKKNFSILNELIDNIPKEKQTAAFSFEDRDKNIRDVLGHLHEWHLMMLRWYNDGMSGIKPVIPAEGYTWKTLPALNGLIWEKYQEVSFSAARKSLFASHKELEKLIKKHTEKELFTKGYYP